LGNLGAPAVRCRGLVKRYEDVTAVDGLDIEVRAGECFGLLGPNGAGKTTTVRMIAHITTPTSGTARVAGYDVRDEPEMVRRHMGLTGQVATVDELLTGRENIRMIGGLYGIRRKALARLGDQLLEQFSIADAADRVVKSYSGGMRRRLDLAVSLLASPPVLFLDEPTTGLDPRSRSDLWEVLRGLVHGGTTLLLTTQYLEEADQLADRVGIIGGGRGAAGGPPAALKAEVGVPRLEVVAALDDLDRAEEVLKRFGDLLPARPGTVHITLPGGPAEVAGIVRALDEAGVTVESLDVIQPTLDDVFVVKTGRSLEGAAEAAPA